MFNKKLKLENAELRRKYVAALERITDLEERVGAYSNKALAEKLFSAAYAEFGKPTLFSQRGLDRLKILNSTMKQLNYRDYIVRTARGRLCIDPLQLALSDEEVETWLARLDEQLIAQENQIDKDGCRWCKSERYVDLVAYIPDSETGDSTTPPNRHCIVCGKRLED